MARHARRVARVRPADGLEHEHRVFHRTRHRAELVQRPAKRHRAGTCHAPERWAQPRHAATHRGADDAPARLAADGKCHQRRGGRRPGAGARPRSALLQKPRVHRLAAEPDVVQGERAERELRQHHRAGVVEPSDHRGVRRGDAVAERLSAVGGRNVFRIEQVFHAVRDAVQRAAVFAGGDLCIRRLRARERVVSGQRDDGANLWVQPFDATEVDIRQSLGCELPRFDPPRQLRHGRERDVVVR